MSEETVVKVMTEHAEKIDHIVRCLRQNFKVTSTSAIIYDQTKRKFHQFLLVT